MTTSLLARFALPLLVALSAPALAACGKADAAPAASASTGSPVAFEVVKVRKDGLDVKATNTGTCTAITMQLLLRYKDASGKVLKVKPGTPFEADFDHWSISGLKFKIARGKTSAFPLDDLPVPAGAAKAEVLVAKLQCLGADGVSIDMKPAFELPPSRTWPAP